MEFKEPLTGSFSSVSFQNWEFSSSSSSSSSLPFVLLFIVL
jgi:hypothetical protein